MSVTVKTGLSIGVLCAAWTFVMGLTGWYKHPILMTLFWVVVVIEVALLIFGLRRTSATNGYWGQVGAGTLMAAIASVIIAVSSLLFTTVAFPSYFADVRAAQEQMMRAAGKTEVEVAQALTAAASMQNPMVQAISGAIGTIITGLVASLVIAGFCRRKGGRAGALA